MGTCGESKNVFAVTSKVPCKCCDSVCPVCFDCSVCSVFAGVTGPDNSDSEPLSVSSSAPLPDADSNSDFTSICSSECSGNDSGDSCELSAGGQVSDRILKESLKLSLIHI